MSSHPGCTMKDAVELAGISAGSWLYAGAGAGLLSDSGNDIDLYVLYRTGSADDAAGLCGEKSACARRLQRALIQYRRPENYELVQEALRIAGRTDLIGFGPECLIRPRQFAGNGRGWTGTQKPSGSYKKAGSGRSSHNGGRIAGADHRRGETHSGQGNRPTSGKKKTIRNVHKKK